LPTKSKPIVIVVDDDQSTRRALRTQLRRAGFKVLEFDSAQKLLDTEFSSPGTCLLLNVHMPGMIGIELCEVLLASGREVPGVLMSAGAEDLRGKATGHAGAVSRRYKPFNEEALLRAVRKALRSKPK
jgi:FixJ family two-component response regulator